MAWCGSKSTSSLKILGCFFEICWYQESLAKTNMNKKLSFSVSSIEILFEFKTSLSFGHMLLLTCWTPWKHPTHIHKQLGETLASGVEMLELRMIHCCLGPVTRAEAMRLSRVACSQVAVLQAWYIPPRAHLPDSLTAPQATSNISYEAVRPASKLVVYSWGGF